MSNLFIKGDFKKSIPIRYNKNHFFSPFLNLQQDISDLFNNFYHSIPHVPTEFINQSIAPLIDIVEDEKNFKVEVEMPGVDEKDIKVSVTDGMLNIKGSKETSRKDEKKDYIMREITYGSYERNISLPDNLDIENAKSTFKKGMLWIDIPKRAIDTSKTKELEVQKAGE